MDEPVGQVVEQSWVGRAFARQAEVRGRGDKATAKMLSPDPVDDDTGRQCPPLPGIDQGVGQFQSAAAFLEGPGLAGREHFQESSWDDLPGAGWVAPAMDCQVADMAEPVFQSGHVLAVGQHEQAGVFQGMCARGIKVGSRLLDLVDL